MEAFRASGGVPKKNGEGVYAQRTARKRKLAEEPAERVVDRGMSNEEFIDELALRLESTAFVALMAKRLKSQTEMPPASPAPSQGESPGAQLPLSVDPSDEDVAAALARVRDRISSEELDGFKNW